MKMQWVGRAFTVLMISVFLIGATLQRKQIEADWGTTAPCVEAIEDIAAEVNERLGKND